MFQRGQISNGTINHRAFLPPNDLKLSTFNVDELDAESIWMLGSTIARESRGEPIAKGELWTQVVIDQQLRALRDDQPPRHVNVVNWPDSKARQKIIAQHLAAATTLAIRYSPAS